MHGTDRHLNLSPLRARLQPPDGIADFHASLGSDNMLRGTFRSAAGGAAAAPLDLLCDGRLLAKLPARREAGADAGGCEFLLPAPQLGGRFAIAAADSPVHHPVDDPQPIAVYPVELGCGHVELAEYRLLNHLAAEANRTDRKSKLLLPVWGDGYIAHFCELCLPSLLSANNLPTYVQSHDLEFVILTRSTDFRLFEGKASVEALRRLVPVKFITIDDILEQYFDPRPRDIYALALTHAYFRGIQSCGEDATSTDFIFWNGDFIAADGAFATLAEIVARGGRCTMAASIRADLGARQSLLRRLTDNGASLQVPPRELVKLALDHPHPTVMAQTLNRDTDRTMENIKQFFWRVSDDAAAARFFVLFMLHIRPEQVWDDINGFCDYAFVPEMVPNSEIVYETNSDRICIFELQDSEREAQWIRHAPIDRDDVAQSIDYWVTEEHLDASRQLVIFNGRLDATEHPDEMAAAAARLDDFMNDIYSRMGGGKHWHNEHIYWRLCFRALNTPEPVPGPDRPRTRPGNLYRWTGYDLDSLIEGWRGGSVLLDNRFAACPKPGHPESGNVAEWLDDLFNAYLSAWRWEPSVRLVDANRISLVDVGRQPVRCPHNDEPQWMIQHYFDFTGVRWGLLEEHQGIWYRLLGPGGGSILLHRTTQRDSFCLGLEGRTFGTRRAQDLYVLVNDEPPSGRVDRVDGERFEIKIYLSQDRIIDWEGRLAIKLIDGAATTADEHAGFGFTGYRIEPYFWVDAELEHLADDRGQTGEILNIQSALWDRGANLISPTLSRLSALRLPASGEDTAIDFGETVVGVGWRHPFSCRGARYRWADGSGDEVLVTRLAPGIAYDVVIVAHRELSNSRLAAACAIKVNDVVLSDVRVDLEESEYHISTRVPAHCASAYDGWIALRLVVDPEVRGESGGRIEFGEPDAGGIAVRSLRLSPSSEAPRPAIPEPLSQRLEARTHSVSEFWQAQVAGRLVAKAASAAPRERACQLLGVDAAWYAAKVRECGAAALASWVCCPAAAQYDAAVASAWLDCVDRQILDARKLAAGQPHEIGFHATVGELDGTGFGSGTSSILGETSRIITPRHAARLLLRLDPEHSWTIELEFGLEAERPRPECVRISLEAETGTGGFAAKPADLLRLSVAGGRLTALVGLSRELLAGLQDSATLVIEHADHPGASERLSLIGLRAAVGSYEVRKDVPELNAAAAFLELDPALYLAALERSDVDLLEAFAGAPELAELSPDLAATLFAYCDYALACKLRLQNSWQADRSEIDLLRLFDGVGWGHVETVAGQTGRSIGRAGAATVFFRAPASGRITLTLECVGKFIPLKLGQISLMLNGEIVDPDGSVVDENAARMAFTFDTALLATTGGAGALRIAVDAALRSTARFRSVGLQWLPGEDRTGMAPVGEGAGGAALAAAAGLGLPTQADQVDRVPGIPVQDLLLARCGRDPALYRSWLDLAGVPLRRLFESCPSESLYPSGEVQAWLDLVDRTFVEALIAAPPMLSQPLCPVLQSVYPWGWGPLSVRSGTMVRSLSGAGDGIIFIPPSFGEKYAVEIHFTESSDRDSLLKLKVTANRRDKLERSVSFGRTGAVLRIIIDPASSDFGMGWVALRLHLEGAGDNDFSISFWQPRTVPPASEIAVDKLQVTPIATDKAELSPTVMPVGNGEARQIGLPAAIHCVVPVWGTEYLKTYLATALPCHLAAGNLPALKGIGTIYEIYTDEVGRQAIAQDPLYPMLEQAVDEVVFFDIRSYRYQERAYHSFHNLLLNYSIMNNCHQTAIARATAHDGALLFLNCDTVYSDGAFARFRELCEEGYRVIENLSIRTDRDAILAVLEAERGADGTLSIGSAALTRIALPRLHWIAKGQFWDGPPDLSIPNNIHWWVSETAVLLRSTHFMPVYVFPRERDVRFSGTIDHGFVPTAGILDSERWLMASADEPSSYEISLPSHDQRFNSYERGSVRDHARFLLQLCENVHLNNLERTVRIAADPVAEERWQQVERYSADILGRIRKKLQKYVMTPWRPDWSTEPDACDLTWSPGLPGRSRAAAPVMAQAAADAASAQPGAGIDPSQMHPRSHEAARSDARVRAAGG